MSERILLNDDRILAAIGQAAYLRCHPEIAEPLERDYRDLCKTQRRARALLEYLDSTTWETREADRVAGRGPIYGKKKSKSAPRNQEALSRARHQVRQQIDAAVAAAAAHCKSPAEWVADFRAREEQRIRGALQVWRS